MTVYAVEQVDVRDHRVRLRSVHESALGAAGAAAEGARTEIEAWPDGYALTTREDASYGLVWVLHDVSSGAYDQTFGPYVLEEWRVRALDVLP